MTAYQYDVLDTNTDQYIGVRLTCREVSEMIGIKTKDVSSRVVQNSLCKGKYRIFRSFTDDELLEWKEEWDVVRLRTLRRIREGRN